MTKSPNSPQFDPYAEFERLHAPTAAPAIEIDEISYEESVSMMADGAMDRILDAGTSHAASQKANVLHFMIENRVHHEAYDRVVGQLIEDGDPIPYDEAVFRLGDSTITATAYPYGDKEEERMISLTVNPPVDEA